MGSTFMLYAVDQESGVHDILVPTSILCWVVPPHGTTQATVATGRLNYFSNPVAFRACLFRQRLGLLLRTVVDVSKGTRP